MIDGFHKSVLEEWKEELKKEAAALKQKSGQLQQEAKKLPLRCSLSVMHHNMINCKKKYKNVF